MRDAYPDQSVLCAGGYIGPFSVLFDFVCFESQVPTGAPRSSRNDLRGTVCMY